MPTPPYPKEKNLLSKILSKKYPYFSDYIFANLEKKTDENFVINSQNCEEIKNKISSINNTKINSLKHIVISLNFKKYYTKNVTNL